MSGSASPGAPHDLESQYNVRLLHPERERYYASYRAASARARASLEAALDLSYGPAPRQRLDVFPGPAGGPVLIFLHGGFWHSHDKSEFSFVASPLVAAGVTVVVPNYGLAPETPLPEICRQVAAAVDWSQREIGRFAADSSRIYLAGHSAGAHLAASALLARPAVRGACLVSGLYDLAPLLRTSFAGQIGLDPATVAACSLLQGLPPSPARLLMLVGDAESEQFRWQSERFAAAWSEAGNDGALLTLPGANHYSVLFPFENGEGAAMERLRLLLA